MKNTKSYNRLGLTAILIVSLAFSGCNSPTGGDDDDDDEQDQPNAEELADDALADLETLLEDMDMASFDPSQGVDGILSSTELADLEDSLEAVLDADSASVVGNVGMAMTTLASVVYRDSVTAAVDFVNEALGAETASSVATSELQTQIAVGSQMIQSLSETPTVPQDWDTIGEVQSELAQILEIVDRSIVYMNSAIDSIGNDSIQITVSGDTVVLDKADLYMFRIAIRNLQIPVAMSVVYDLRLFTAGGEFTVTNDTTEEQLKAAASYSIEHQKSFLSRRTDGPTLSSIRNAIEASMDDAVNAYNGMMARTGDQTRYLIPNDQLEIPSEFYQEIQSGLADAGVSSSISKVEDIRDVVKDILDGTETLLATDPDLGNDYTVDLGNFFDSTDGLRDWLPKEYALARIQGTEPPAEWSLPDPSFDGTVSPSLSKVDFAWFFE